MHRVMKWIGVAVIAVVALGVWAYWSAGKPPGWYAPPMIDDLAADRASRVELGCMATFQKIRPAQETWTLRLTEDGINLWLSARLREWATNHFGHPWPVAMGPPQVLLEEGALQIGVRTRDGWVPSLTIHPVVTDGSVYFHISGGSIGQFSAPGLATVLAALTRNLMPSTGNTAALFDGRGFPAVVTLIDGRRVEILDIDAQKGQVILNARTLPAHEKAGGGEG